MSANNSHPLVSESAKVYLSVRHLARCLGGNLKLVFVPNAPKAIIGQLRLQTLVGAEFLMAISCVRQDVFEELNRSLGGGKTA